MNILTLGRWEGESHPPFPDYRERELGQGGRESPTLCPPPPERGSRDKVGGRVPPSVPQLPRGGAGTRWAGESHPSSPNSKEGELGQGGRESLGSCEKVGGRAPLPPS